MDGVGGGRGFKSWLTLLKFQVYFLSILTCTLRKKGAKQDVDAGVIKD